MSQPSRAFTSLQKMMYLHALESHNDGAERETKSSLMLDIKHMRACVFSFTQTQQAATQVSLLRTHNRMRLISVCTLLLCVFVSAVTCRRGGRKQQRVVEQPIRDELVMMCGDGYMYVYTHVFFATTGFRL